MDFPFIVPGYEHIPLTLRPGIFSGAKILYQGTPLKKIPGRKFVLALEDGSELTLGLKPNARDLLVPQVVHNADVIAVAPKLPIYQQVLIYLPFLLIFVGGALGGLCGGIGSVANLALFHGSQPLALKIILSLLVTLAAVLVWVVAGALIYSAIHH